MNGSRTRMMTTDEEEDGVHGKQAHRQFEKEKEKRKGEEGTLKRRSKLRGCWMMSARGKDDESPRNCSSSAITSASLRRS